MPGTGTVFGQRAADATGADDADLQARRLGKGKAGQHRPHRGSLPKSVRRREFTRRGFRDCGISWHLGPINSGRSRQTGRNPLCLALSDYCRAARDSLCSVQQVRISCEPQTQTARIDMKPHVKVLLLAVLVLPGGVLLLLVPPAKMLWRYGAERLARRAA
jgi:hypothetical protein